MLGLTLASAHFVGESEEVPEDVLDSLTAHAAAIPDKVAVIDPEESDVTYAGLEERANRLAHGLRHLGLGPGDRIVWCGPNSLEVLVVLHAARKLGLVAVPLAYRFTPDEMRHVIADSGAVVVLVDAEPATRLAAIRADLPAVRDVVVFRGEPFDGALAWDDVLAGGSADPLPPVEGGGQMIYTSGTTGKPRRVRCVPAPTPIRPRHW